MHHASVSSAVVIAESEPKAAAWSLIAIGSPTTSRTNVCSESVVPANVACARGERRRRVGVYGREARATVTRQTKKKTRERRT